MYSFYEIVEIWEVDFFWRVVVGVLISEKIEIFLRGGMGGEFYFFNPIRSGLFQTVNDPGGGGGGGFKSPPLRSRKLLCQSSPYHTCEFYQVF